MKEHEKEQCEGLEKESKKRKRKTSWFRWFLKILRPHRTLLLTMLTHKIAIKQTKKKVQMLFLCDRVSKIFPVFLHRPKTPKPQNPKTPPI